MKYTELSPEGFQNNVIKPIANRLICLAHVNADFKCSDCLRTIEVLKDILCALDSEFAKVIIEEVNDILEGEE